MADLGSKKSPRFADAKRGLFPRIVVTLAGTFCLVGCAALGSRAKIHDCGRLRDVRVLAIGTINVVPLQDQTISIGENPIQIVKSVLTRELSAAFPNAKIFPLPETGVRSLHKDGEIQSSKALGADAVIISRLSFLPHVDRRIKQITSEHAVDSTIVATVIEVETGSELAKVKFGTLLGKAYAFPQPAIQTIEDAAAGVVERLTKRIDGCR